MTTSRAIVVRYLLGTLAMLMLSGIARAETLDLARLMRLLAAAPHAEADYVEQKHSALLSEPIVSSGKLFYRAGVVEKIMLTPRKESLRIVGDELVVERKGKERRVPLSSQPALGALAASLRGVLSGDAELLRKHYRLMLSGAEAAWQLELVPLDEETLRYVERIAVAGKAGRVAEIEIREATGDRSVMRIR
jgi:hypothetical protein